MLRIFFPNRFLSQPLSKELKCSANNFRWFEKIETVQPKIILYEFGRDLQFEAFFAEAVVELFPWPDPQCPSPMLVLIMIIRSHLIGGTITIQSHGYRTLELILQ